MRRAWLTGLLVLVPSLAFAAADITFLHTTAITTDLTTYTFAAEALGTAVADRCILVEVYGRRTTAAATTISSVTVAGNSATDVGQHNLVEGAASVVGLYGIALPTGTSGDIVVTFSAAMTRAMIAVSTMTGASSCTVASDVESSDANDPTTSALDVPANGSAIGLCLESSPSSTATWTGLTERHDSIVEALMLASGASTDFTSAQTGLTVTCDIAINNAGETGIFLSFGPAAAGSTKPARVIGGGVF
jgi:hypothetical protein